MSDFYNQHEYRKAIKPHRCTYCGEAIYKGDQYTFQKGNYDGRWYESKMHDECFNEMCEEGDGEYIPYSNERPQRVNEPSIPLPTPAMPSNFEGKGLAATHPTKEINFE